jgi:hypothetical protein
MDFDTRVHLRDHSQFTGLARLLLIEAVERNGRENLTS